MQRLTGRTLGLGIGGALLLCTLATGATADPPRPGTTDSGLNESEAATLWANQPADGFVSNEAYRATYGERRTTLHEIANGTDVTFAQPPATAQRWTRYAHDTYTPGDRNTSVHPPHAELEASLSIEDAHATIFALSPATKAHVESNDERLYVKPEGRLLGTVDYRVEAPPMERSQGREVRWAVVDHEITEIRVYADGELIETEDGSHHPDVAYDLDPETDQVRLEADIEASVVKTVSEWNATRSHADQNRTKETTHVTDSLTVADSMGVDVYDLKTVTSRVEYPDGDTGVTIVQSDPWQGYSLTADGAHSVRGIWRFVTARETVWDELVHASSDDKDRVESHVLPVYVHAYPSRMGPRTEPTYGGPTIVRTWAAATHAAPSESLPENVSVEVVDSAYEPTRGIAVRSSHVDPSELTVHGIVHGTEATNLEFPGRTPRIHESELTATVIEQNESGATVLLSLEDARTGQSIELAGDAADSDDGERGGYIEIDGERVATNETGHAAVVLPRAGTYTARYEPASWLDTSPAYASDSTVVRWHPLTTIGGWLTLLMSGLLVVVPFGVAWIAGRRLGAFLEWRRF